MEQPEGFVVPGQESKVLRLWKAIYGLKQASRAFHEELKREFEHIELIRSEADFCVYRWEDEDGTVVIIIVHVDDMGAGSNSLNKLTEVKERLRRRFEVSDLGDIKLFLGIQIIRDYDARTISLSQKHFILDVVERFSMLTLNPVATPLPAGAVLTHKDCPEEGSQEQQEMKRYLY
jgi:hypothetical protein